MSQLRNLLTNKVANHQHGSRREYRRSRGYIAPGVAARIRSEITEQRALAQSQRQPKPQPKPGLLRRVGNFLTRAFKGS